MNTSEIILAKHINRKAVIYIRQSTPNQVLTNQESLKLQYALREKAVDLGWEESTIQIIDSDLGKTGSSVEARHGFKNLVALVTLGKVGIILSYEVTRLSRNCTDWYQLLDICGLRDCLIGDRDGIYDPSTHNGRFILGLKGQISEMELHTLKGRLTAGLLNKAQRGELALQLPVGLVRDTYGIVSKDPDTEIQCRLELIFETFLRVKSASKTLKYFLENDLKVPRRDSLGDLWWKAATNASIIRILKNPAYAGMFVYGRFGYNGKDEARQNNSRKELAIDDWKIKVEDKYPAYISLKTFENIRSMLKDNYAEYDREKTRGIPRPGKALLHGIVYCGECGHKMVVQYKNSTRYMCNYLRRQHGTTVCQYIPGDPVDDHVVSTFFDALSEVEVNIYQTAMAQKSESDNKSLKARLQQLERLRYQARLAERQYNQADPENRLVASELEKRWEVKLKELRNAESQMENNQMQCSIPISITQEMTKAFAEIGSNLPNIWSQNLLSQEQKKRLLRSLIEKIIIHHIKRDVIRTTIVWKGGETSTSDISIIVGSIVDLSNAQELENAVLDLAKKGKVDSEISLALTKIGFRSPLRKTLLPSTVQVIRLRKGVKFRRGKKQVIENFLTVAQIADAVGVKPQWIYDRIYKGKISVRTGTETTHYLFPDKPSTIEKFKKLVKNELKKLNF